jgi:hypothetical protein
MIFPKAMGQYSHGGSLVEVWVNFFWGGTNLGSLQTNADFAKPTTHASDVLVFCRDGREPGP